MLDEQKTYFVIEIIVSLICIGIGVGFFVNRQSNGLEFTFTAIGIALVYLFMFFFVLNDTVLEDFDGAKKVMVILFYLLSLATIALLPVVSKVPYAELFKTNDDGNTLAHPTVLAMIIGGLYVLCYPVLHFFTKERNPLLQLIIKPISPMVIPALPILFIVLLVKAKREVFGVSEGGYYPESDSESEVEETKILRFSDGHEEEVDYESNDAYHTSTGWHSKDDEDR